MYYIETKKEMKSCEFFHYQSFLGVRHNLPGLRDILPRTLIEVQTATLAMTDRKRKKKFISTYTPQNISFFTVQITAKKIFSTATCTYNSNIQIYLHRYTASQYFHPYKASA